MQLGKSPQGFREQRHALRDVRVGDESAVVEPRDHASGIELSLDFAEPIANLGRCSSDTHRRSDFFEVDAEKVFESRQQVLALGFRRLLEDDL